MKLILLCTTCLTLGFAGGLLLADSPSPAMQAGSVEEAGPGSAAPGASRADAASGLEQELAAAEAELLRLREQNDLLIAQIGAMNLPVAHGESYSALMERIDGLPTPVLRQQLVRVFDEESIEGIRDVRAFSKRLMDVVLDANPAEDEAPVTATVQFSLSAIFGNRPLPPGASIGRYDTVFAHVTAPAALGPVVVKWQHADSGELLELNDYVLSGVAGSSFVAHRPSGGWRPGRYRVEVHALNDAVAALGGNEFALAQVTGDEAPPEGPNRQYIQELIEAGQAVPKRPR